MKEKVIACDIGGTNMRIALVEHEKILDEVVLRTPKNKKKFLSLLIDHIEHFDSSAVRKIGIGIAGQVKDGVVLNTPNIGLKNLHLKKILEEEFGIPVYIANDADCFAVAELYLGIKKDNFVAITLGTGIGGAIIDHREFYRGGRGFGVEFGHMYVKGKDWESLWQASKREAIRVFGPGTVFSDLLGVHKHHRKAKQIIKETVDHLGQGIASLINTLDPQAVVIGGGARKTGKKFLSMIKLAVKKYALNKNIPPITWSTLEQPGVLGASLLMS